MTRRYSGWLPIRSKRERNNLEPTGIARNWWPAHAAPRCWRAVLRGDGRGLLIPSAGVKNSRAGLNIAESAFRRW